MLTSALLLHSSLSKVDVIVKVFLRQFFYFFYFKKSLDMEYCLSPFSKSIACNWWPLVRLWIANTALKAWKTRRTFAILKNNCLL